MFLSWSARMNSIHFIYVKVFSRNRLRSCRLRNGRLAVGKKPSKARGTYKVYSDKDRFSIEKNVSIYGTASTVRRCKNIYPHVNESTVCGFKKHYKAQINDEIRKNMSPKTVIVNKLQGRPCLL